MKASHVVIVGMIFGLLITPIAWADSESTGDDGVRGLDWVENVVTWIAGLVTESPDPTATTTDLFSPVDESGEELQSTPSEGDRQGGLDPAGNTAR